MGGTDPVISLRDLQRCLQLRDSTPFLVGGLVLSADGDSFEKGAFSFPVLVVAAAFVYGGWKIGSIPASAAEPGHTFQFISAITFLIANKLINYAAGALETPEASLLPASACPPSLTENINLLLMLSIMEAHNSKINYFASEWMTFLGVRCWPIFLGAPCTIFCGSGLSVLTTENKFY